MRTYRVVIWGRTFNTFKTKEQAVECAKNCVAVGYDNVYVGYGNYNPVPKTPSWQQTEKRELGKAYTIHLMEEKEPYRTVQTFKADTIIVIADANKIDGEFYREFWIDGVMTGRYSSKEYSFDFGADWCD